MSVITASDDVTPRRTSVRRRHSLEPATIVGAITFLAVFGPMLTSYRPAALSGDPIEAPSRHHLLGTNLAGQDLFSYLVNGARASVVVAVCAGLLAVTIGTLLGAAAGWHGGAVASVIGRLVDLVMVIPRLPLLILLGGYVGTSVVSTAVVIASVSWAGISRSIRARVEVVRARGHLRAAKGFGAGSRHVLRRHLVPAVAPLVAASFVSVASRAVVLEAGLAFLGIGDLTRVSWGSTLREALEFGSLFRTNVWQWWLVPPVAAVTALTLLLARLATLIETLADPRLALRRTSKELS